jgi:hypothetical protein
MSLLNRSNRWNIRRARLNIVGIVLFAFVCVMLAVWLQDRSNRLEIKAAIFRVKVAIYDFINKNHIGERPNKVDAYIADRSLDGELLRLTKSRQKLWGSGSLRVCAKNPRYFSNQQGDAIYLTGSHYWSNFQDGGLSFDGAPPAFDYAKYLEFLESQNHNFIRLWRWEQAKWVVEWPSDYYFSPMPYVRWGPGVALDGKPKFDLDQLDEEYFLRLRKRVVEAGDRGIYVSIMLFNGWSLMREQYPSLPSPWKGHPYNGANNTNQIDGDKDDNHDGEETHTLLSPHVLRYQEAFVRKVIDTVNDLDNVLYEISNESPDDSIKWQYHMIDYIKAYESRKAYQHPVGMTGRMNRPIQEVTSSVADWISPGGLVFRDDPPSNVGGKVIITDTDHIWGIGGTREWVWKSFMRGLNPIFMDQYDDSYKVEGGLYDLNNENDAQLRQSLGYTRYFSERINLVNTKSREDLCSSGYCLAAIEPGMTEFLVYVPSGDSVSIDLNDIHGALSVEWFNPATGQFEQAPDIEGGSLRSFNKPSDFQTDAVLYLHDRMSNPVTSPNSICS